MSARPFLTRCCGCWVLGLALLASPKLAAQSPRPISRVGVLTDSARTMIDRASPMGDVDALHAAEALLERAATAAPTDAWVLHYLGFALYREAGIRMGRKLGDSGPLLERADSIFEGASHLADIPETHALRSGVLGMLIGTNPIRGMTLGPRSGSEMERALALGPNNPRVWLLRGIGAINTPPMFGGGLDRAEEYLRKSIDLYATDKPTAPAPSWGAGEVHAWLGMVYAKENRTDAARAEYQKALAIEPNDMRTRKGLLPALDSKP